MVLTLEGFSTHIAYDGRSAIETARRRQPDIIVLDICMPDLSGLEVAKSDASCGLIRRLATQSWSAIRLSRP
nr:response regulator [Caballeronia sp. GAWG1-5s-s]